MLCFDENKISVLAYKNVEPQIHSSVFIADGARIIGDVKLEDQVSIWFNTVIRGDVNSIAIGASTNIQDNSLLHVENGLHPLNLGEGVTVGHCVTLHGCDIGNYCLIGMGATVMNGVKIGDESVIGAGAVVPEGMVIPPRSLVVGLPGKVRRQLGDEEVQRLHLSAEHYVKYYKSYFED